MIKTLKDELYKYRKLILIYVSICMVVAVLASPIFGTSDLINVHASDTETVSAGETIWTLTTMFTGSALKNIAGSYASVVGVSAEPFTALLYLGLIENINRLCGSPLNIISTPAGNPIVLLLVSIFFVASKLMKANEATKLFGTCTLGELEKYLGLAFILILGVMNVVGVTDYFVTNKVAAAVGEAATNSSIIVGIFSAIISVFMAMVSVVVYIVIKTVFFGLDALQSLIPIPCAGLVVEIFKSVFVIVVITINVLFPWIGVALNILVFIICCFFLRFCINIANFLRIIYIRPFFKRIRGFSDTYPLVSRRLPKKLRKNLEAEGMEIKTAVMSYAYKSKEAEEFNIKYMNRFWLVSDGRSLYAFTKKKFRNKWNKYVLETTDKKTLYLKKEFRFIELFTATHNEKGGVKKDTRFIFSNEYSKRFDELCELFNAENYNKYKSDLKLTRKEERKVIRELKKEQRKLWMQNTKAKLKDFFDDYDLDDLEEYQVLETNDIKYIEEEANKWQ